MINWYDRIGNRIEMELYEDADKSDFEWVKGNVIEGYRYRDGIVSMKSDDGRIIWCGVQSGDFRKSEDSLGDFISNADRIRSFSDEEMAEFLADSEIFSPCKNCDFHFVDAMNDDCKAPDGWICTKGYAAALIQKWPQSEVEE